jgi:monoamine oxidase
VPGGRLSTLARAMRERAQFDAPAGPGRGTPLPGGGTTLPGGGTTLPGGGTTLPGGGTTLPGGAPGGAGRGVVSRRGLLRMGGAAGVSAALAACTTRSSPAAGGTKAGTPAAQGVRVAVIGAGLAGTTAAYRLARSGVQVRLFEARDRIGGRCWTARGFADGQTAEHGGEFIDTRHVHLRSLAREFGLQLDDLWQGDVPDAISPSWINGGYYDYYDKFNAQLDRITTVVQAAARQIGVTSAQGTSSDVAYSYGTATPGARQMDELNMREWLDQHVPGVSAEVKTFLDQAMSGAPSRPVIADHVILTIPWTTLREVDLEGAGLSSYRMTAIRELGMGTDVKLIVQYNRRPATFKVHGRPWSGTVNYTNPNYQTWDSAPTEPGTAGLITVYADGSGSKPFAGPGYHAPAPQDLTATVLGQINQAVPGTKAQFNGKAWLDYWTGDPWTRGSYAAYIPGQVTKYWGYAGIPEGRVHFAGEHTSTYSQGFLNGGVESGQRAAIEVLLALGLPVPAGIASLPYSRIPGEHIGVGDRW